MEKNINENLLNINKSNDDIIYGHDKIKNSDLSFNKLIAKTNFSDLFYNLDEKDIIFPNPIGREYNVARMWSPVSDAGKVYKWVRGVIGIGRDGRVVENNLDISKNVDGHGGATVEIIKTLTGLEFDTAGGNNLNGRVALFNFPSPFESAINGAEAGLVIFQSEGNNAFVYFPDTITSEQYRKLVNIITPRYRFTFSFTYGKEIYEEQTASDVLSFANKIFSVTPVKK